MRYLVSMFLLLFFSSLAQAAEITRMEYFYDDDPGVGNGTALSFTAGSAVTTEFQAPLAGLAAGIHYLYLRAMDSDGDWGISRVRAFYMVPATALAIPSITRMEYFVDADPGYGAATPVTNILGPNPEGQVLIGLSGLALGSHTLNVRARDANGLWSAVQGLSFEISDTVPLVDTDNDGMDDQWEQFYFHSLATATAGSDFDDDGYSDVQEYQHWAAGENDPDNNLYDPTVDNTPGAPAPKATSSFWTIMLPVILNGSHQ